MQLDHLFICCEHGAPEADRLLELGLVEGPSNTHPGQGTANRRFLFANAFLELLWVCDPAEAQSEVARRTCLWERWSQRDTGASPFGIGLRPAANEMPEPAFPTWEYRLPYMPAPLAIHMGTNSEVPAEPLLFHLAFGRRPDSYDAARLQPLNDDAGWRTITRVEISTTSRIQPSPALRAVAAHCPWLSYRRGSENLLELGFDDEQTGQTADLRPVLPLVVRW